jgi:two-component system, OmpR family, heavy metal sensor histidine kinase CusS
MDSIEVVPRSRPSATRRVRRWLRRTLNHPQQLTGTRQIVAIFILCTAGLALVLFGETVEPGVTLGSYALIAVLAGTWILPTTWAMAVVVIALGVLAAAVIEGSVEPVTGGFQLAATLLMATVSRVAGRALRRSQVRRNELHQKLLSSERQRADEAADQLAEKERLSGELREAIVALGKQAGELRRLNSRLIDFTADAAHELRAPLAIMRTVADRALARPRGASEYRDSLTTLQREVVRLSELSDALLMLARADHGQLVAQRASLDVADFLADLAARWQAIADGHGLTIELDLPDDGTVEADPVLLGRLFDNLLDNACRYSPSDGMITLAARSAPSGWRLSVANTGATIAPELRDEIFERFRRGDPARQRETGGAGLGLALCQTIARLHGGTVRLDASDDDRTRFTVELP